jgi:hypothetical protein
MTAKRRKRSAVKDRAALVAALKERSGHKFRAAKLKRFTGVPKNIVRGLLTGVKGIFISKKQGAYWYSAGAAGQ